MNNATYTKSGSYSSVSGWVNEVLNLTIENLCDVDNNPYDTAVIGTQVWFSENLRVSKYRNGDAILTGLSDVSWEATTSDAYANYNNYAANDQTYGKLYNWYAVADSRGLCRIGWHVPSDEEWQSFETSLGMSASDMNLIGGRGITKNVGGKMKATGIIGSGGLWNSPNTGATNSIGFAGLPGGDRTNNGIFGYIGEYGFWWTST